MERRAHPTSTHRRDLLDIVGHRLPRFRGRAAAARLGNFISEDPAWDDLAFEDDLAPTTDIGGGTPIAE